MNKNIAVFKLLYEEACKQLHEQVQGIINHRGSVGSPTDGLRQQVNWVHETAKAMVLISQIESNRQSNPSTSQPQTIPVQPQVSTTKTMSDFNPPQPVQPRQRDF